METCQRKLLLQAPTTMKSILQAGWLLTVASGNIVVIILAYGGSAISQVYQLVIHHFIFNISPGMVFARTVLNPEDISRTKFCGTVAKPLKKPGLGLA